MAPQFPYPFSAHEDTSYQALPAQNIPLNTTPYYGDSGIYDPAPNSYDHPPLAHTNSFEKIGGLGSTVAVPGNIRRRKHPFFARFEAPDWKMISLHIIICLLTFPILYLVEFIAKRHSLFWTRTVVSIGITVIGIAMGFTLTELAARLLEASSWATTIHQTRIADSTGIPLREFSSRVGEGGGVMLGMHLVKERWTMATAVKRERKTYDRKWWSLYLIFFLFIMLLSQLMGFALDRVVDIFTILEHQRLTYEEVSVMGDLSAADIDRGSRLQSVFETFSLTWTLEPFSTGGSVPPPILLRWEENNRVDDVYFAEATKSQFLPNGTGFGTFEFSTEENLGEKDFGLNRTVDPSDPISPGHLVRYPRYGIRIHCERVPDPDVNIIPRSESTRSYILAPTDVLRGLFDHYKLDLPSRFNVPMNRSNLLEVNDTIPANVDPSKIAWRAPFFDTGTAHSIRSEPISMGEDGKGFASIEAVLVRLNTTFAPRGTFARTLRTDTMTLGFDGLLCLQLYEPYIVEAYNSTVGDSATTNIISKGAVTTPGPKDIRTSRPLKEEVIRELNSTRLPPIYIVLHANSVNRLLKDNGPLNYVPNPTVVSFTGNSGPEDYTDLSPEHFARAKGMADATNILPYLAGSGATFALAYPDLVLAYAKVNLMSLIVVVGAIMVIGIVAGMSVPKLPLGIPRRGFQMYSWMAALYGSEFIGEQAITLEKNIDVEELDRRVGQIRFRFNRS